MLDMYAIVNKKDAVTESSDFEDLIDIMIKQTMKCAFFIKEYGQEAYWCEYYDLFRAIDN
jgi:hypothetical protein